MLFAIDIDRTIAIDSNGCARYLNRVLDLGISEAVIDSLDAYYLFEELPQVQAFRETQDDLYQQAIQIADHAPEVMMATVPIEGAVEAVKRLSQKGRIIYATCRKPEEIDVTRAWLTSYGFPEPDAVASCEHYYWKYIHAHKAANSKEQVVIIDDMMEQVVRSFGSVAREHPQIAYSLLPRLEVVGFDQKTPPQLPKKMPFAWSLLPSWQPAHFDAWHPRARAATVH